MGPMEKGGTPGGTEDPRDRAPFLLDRIPLHSTNLITVLGGEGTIRYESPAIDRIFGFDEDALIGEPLEEYIHPDHRAEVTEHLREIVAGKNTGSSRWNIVTQPRTGPNDGWSPSGPQNPPPRATS